MNRGFRGGLAAALALGAAAAAPAAPELHVGDGGWALVAGAPATARPPAEGDWRFTEGTWIGRLPAGAETLEWDGATMAVAEAPPPPLAPAELPLKRNSFGECAVKSLSVRYDPVVRSRRWSLLFSDEGAEQDFEPLPLPDGRRAALAMELEDVDTGRRWELRPSRRGREGGLIPAAADARFHAGMVDEGDLDWSLVTFPKEDGRRIVQGRLMAVKSDVRRLRARIYVAAGAEGEAVLQAEPAPAVVAVADGVATGLFPDLAEPRRCRAATGRPGMIGIEFDLAPTRDTANFPRKATFGLEVDAWETAGPEAAPAEALARLARAGGTVPVPEEVLRAGAAAAAVYAPARQDLEHPGGFRDGADALNFLMLKTAAPFAERDWAASALQCAARDAAGRPRVAREGDRAVVTVNPDPDLETMLELGQNRGLTLLDRLQRSGAKAAWIRASGASPGLDHGARALRMCDYPAIWEEAGGAPGVDVRHAEAELIASLACALRPAGVCLIVEDGGPLAPYTTHHADALACGSAEPAEMRRQRALAGPRPVLWTAEDPDAAAAALARDLGFVRPGEIGED